MALRAVAHVAHPIYFVGVRSTGPVLARRSPALRHDKGDRRLGLKAAPSKEGGAPPVQSALAAADATQATRTSSVCRVAFLPWRPVPMAEQRLLNQQPNRVLRSLSPADLDLLQPNLEPTPLEFRK